MPKDSQPDKKEVRKKKSKGKTTITEEAQNNTRNTKKQSVQNDDV